MRYLEKKEVEEIVAKGRASSEQEITEMLDALEEKHPYIYQFIFGEPSDGIAMINTRLSSFFVRDNLMSYFIRTIVYILYFNEGLGSNLPKSLPTICLADGISLKCSLTS